MKNYVGFCQYRDIESEKNVTKFTKDMHSSPTVALGAARLIWPDKVCVGAVLEAQRDCVLPKETHTQSKMKQGQASIAAQGRIWLKNLIKQHKSMTRVQIRSEAERQGYSEAQIATWLGKLPLRKTVKGSIEGKKGVRTTRYSLESQI